MRKPQLEEGVDGAMGPTGTASDDVSPRTISQEPIIRAAAPDDLRVMFDIRGLVDENRMSRSELAAVGITEETVRSRLGPQLAAWVAGIDGEVVGYSMADRLRGCVYAIFVLPAFQGRGIGGALLDRASVFLFGCGFGRIFLNTDASTRAYRFYLREGWVDAGESNGTERRLELSARSWA